MPLYEYRCPRCGWEDEQMRPIAERDSELACEPCLFEQYQWVPMKRIVSAVAGVVKNPAVPKRTR